MHYSKTDTNLTPDEISEKIETYERFIEDVLKRDLRLVERTLEEKVAKFKEWEEVVRSVALLKEFADKDDDDMSIQVDIGCNVAFQATVTDYERTFVDLGLGCFLEMDRLETVKYAEIRMRGLHREIEHFRASAAKIKARIKVTLLAIHELMMCGGKASSSTS